MKYILFVAQEGNFIPRSMLIPVDEFLTVPKRESDFEFLKKHVTSKTFEKGSQQCIVDNLLQENYIEKEEHGKQEDTPINQIISDLKTYAEYGSEHGYSLIEDKEWVDKIIPIDCESFSIIDHYIDCKAITKYKGKDIEIMHSFLVLETINGQLRPLCPYKSIEEMMTKVYRIASNNQ